MIAPSRPNDEGSILPLIAFAAAFALVLVFLVVSATSLYLEHKRLLTLADGAALVGAEAFELSDVSVQNERVEILLTSPKVAAAVESYLETAPREFDDLRLESAESVDGSSATVTLSADWRPPVVSLFVPEGLRIEVEATARSVFG